MAWIEEEVHYKLGGVGWDGKTDPNEAAIRFRIGKCGIDPDDIAIAINERAARIAMIDGCVGLNIAVECLILQVAV